MIAVCGEALVDLVPGGDRRYVAHPGGSPLNVAVGLARLEIPTTMLARLGGDEYGALLRQHLTDNGVDCQHLVHGTEPTSQAVVAVDPAGVPRYTFRMRGTADWQWRAGELPRPLPAEVEAFHTGSLAAVIPGAAEHVAALLRYEHQRARVTLSYDPNLRPQVMGERHQVAARVEELIGLVDVVKVSAEDLAWLYPEQRAPQIAARWIRSGPALVVVTDGASGARATTVAGAAASYRPPPVSVVDTVGAGDAFTAGMLAWLRLAGMLGADGRGRIAALDEPELTALLASATAVAADTCTRPGADPPTREQLRPWPRPVERP